VPIKSPNNPKKRILQTLEPIMDRELMMARMNIISSVVPFLDVTDKMIAGRGTNIKIKFIDGAHIESLIQKEISPSPQSPPEIFEFPK
jgi:hypothetical protein